MLLSTIDAAVGDAAEFRQKTRYIVRFGDNGPKRRKTVVKSAKRAILFFTPALAVLLPLAAQAAPPGFRRDYAAAAVRQVELARAIPACNRGAGPRWTTDFRVHFQWCLGAAPGIVEAERAARTNWLRHCRGM
jgi:hypothetical protein